MPPDHLIDEFTLLCERCGYVIEGLPDDGACPECGKPIAESLPRARVGSPWQQRGFRAWFATARAMIHHPRATFSIIAIETPPSYPLHDRNLMTAAALMAIASAATVLSGTGSRFAGPKLTDHDIALAVVTAPVVFAVVFAILPVLVAIERAGIRFFGARRQWRITPAVARSICAHASFGWLASGPLMMVMTEGSAALRAAFGWPPSWAGYLVVPPAFLAGMLCFETLVFIGMRRCKFANRPRPAPLTTPNSPPTDPPVTAA